MTIFHQQTLHFCTCRPPRPATAFWSLPAVQFLQKIISAQHKISQAGIGFSFDFLLKQARLLGGVADFARNILSGFDTRPIRI
jgi:hypothetical protein